MGATDPKIDIDHRDGNTLNNQRDNLRIATRTQNNANAKTPKDNRSGYKGVSFDKARGKYQAQCRVNGKKKHLGYFTTSQEAYAAYKRFKEYLCKKTANKWQSQIDSRAYKSMMNWCV